MDWSVLVEPVGSVAKRNSTNRNIMFLSCWITRDIIRKEYLKKANIMDYKLCREILIRGDAAIKAKRPKVPGQQGNDS